MYRGKVHPLAYFLMSTVLFLVMFLVYIKKGYELNQVVVAIILLLSGVIPRFIQAFLEDKNTRYLRKRH